MGRVKSELSFGASFTINKIRADKTKIFFEDTSTPEKYFYIDIISRTFNTHIGNPATYAQINKISNSIYHVRNMVKMSEIPNWTKNFLYNLIRKIDDDNLSRRTELFKRLFIDTIYGKFHNYLYNFTPILEKISKHSNISVSTRFHWNDSIKNTEEGFAEYTKIFKPNKNYNPYAIDNTWNDPVSTDIASVGRAYKDLMSTSMGQFLYNELKDRITPNIVKTISNYGVPKLTEFRDRYGYEPKRLLKYLMDDVRWQGLPSLIGNNTSNFGSNYGSSSDPIDILRDYAKMSKDIIGNNKFDKYPQYLKTVHDIVAMNYKMKEDEIKNKKTEERYKILMEKYHFKKYGLEVIAPRNMEDIQKEGTNQHHCVASYAEDHAEGEKTILFIRKSESIEESYLTMEVDSEGNIVQVKGFGNRSLNEEEDKFVKAFEKYINPKVAEENAQVEEEVAVQ